jgi:hypothetical protein
VSPVRCARQSNSKILKGKIGITLNCDWREPISQNQADIDAANV